MTISIADPRSRGGLGLSLPLLVEAVAGALPLLLLQDLGQVAREGEECVGGQQPSCRCLTLATEKICFAF